MPNPNTPVWQIPGPDLSDGADIEGSLDPIRNRLEALLTQVYSGVARLGCSLAYDGASDPGPDPDGVVRWILRDGRLIDRTVYTAYFALIGHSANGGVDPGANQMRIPDKRGRVGMGPDNMGTAMGAAARIQNSNRILGQSGGVERYPLTVSELAPHIHKLPQPDRTTADVANNNAITHRGTAGGPPDLLTSSTGLGDPHYNLSPYLVENFIVRIR